MGPGQKIYLIFLIVYLTNISYAKTMGFLITQIELDRIYF